MRLATRRDGSRDGELVVVSAHHDRWVSARGIAPNLQAALDAWDQLAPELARLDRELASGAAGEPSDFARLSAPLPRAYEWIDGSAFVQHIELVRRARGAALPENLLREPLVYQGGSGCLLGPYDAFPLADEAWGLDLEAEVAVVVGDTPRGVSASRALDHVRLILLANDWTLRELVPAELAKGFGFFVAKPATSFSPLALTPDELGAYWREGRVHLPLESSVNGRRLGEPHAGEMHFSFGELIAHAAQTRSLTAGTIVGSGTVSNRDPSRGASCLVEQRTREVLAGGAATTSYLKVGDRVRIEMRDPAGVSLFGSIDQTVVAA
ncbi:MAG TPA: fumarylacetoacetate hydrolase family protein [Polyangiaceae bacterium]